MNTLRIVLVDDHEVVRLGLRTVLEDLEDVEIVAEAGSGEAAIAACERYEPDVVIMDIRMPGKSGVQACKTIVGRWPQTRVIMLTSYANDELIAESIQAGAVGYVLKQVGTAELIRALDAVRQGAASLDPSVTQRVLAMMRHRNEPPPDPFRDLTGRELDILRLLATGKSNMEIAGALSLSEKTVRNHVSTLLSKLHLNNRVEAATFAVQHDLQAYRRQ
jgi:DNA-binding NarL/FixJ family response regulator